MMRNRNQSENYSHHILTCLANTHSPIEIDPIRGLMCWLPLNCFVATFQNDDVWIHRRGENARIARIAYLPNYRCTMSSIDSSMKWIKSQSWHYTWIRRPIEYFVLNSCSLFLFFSLNHRCSVAEHRRKHIQSEINWIDRYFRSLPTIINNDIREGTTNFVHCHLLNWYHYIYV